MIGGVAPAAAATASPLPWGWRPQRSRTPVRKEVAVSWFSPVLDSAHHCPGAGRPEQLGRIAKLLCPALPPGAVPRACGMHQLKAAAAAAAATTGDDGGEGGRLVFPLDRLCLVQSAQLSHEVCGPQNSHLPDEEIEAERLNKLLYNPKVAEEFHSVTLEVIFLTAPLTCLLLLLPGRDTWGGMRTPILSRPPGPASLGSGLSIPGVAHPQGLPGPWLLLPPLTQAKTLMLQGLPLIASVLFSAIGLGSPSPLGNSLLGHLRVKSKPGPYLPPYTTGAQEVCSRPQCGSKAPALQEPSPWTCFLCRGLWGASLKS